MKFGRTSQGNKEFINYDEHGVLSSGSRCSALKMPCGFPGGSPVKNPPANAGDTGDVGSITGLGRSPGGGNGNPF